MVVEKVTTNQTSQTTNSTSPNQTNQNSPIESAQTTIINLNSSSSSHSTTNFTYQFIDSGNPLPNNSNTNQDPLHEPQSTSPPTTPISSTPGNYFSPSKNKSQDQTPMNHSNENLLSLQENTTTTSSSSSSTNTYDYEILEVSTIATGIIATSGIVIATLAKKNSLAFGALFLAGISYSIYNQIQNLKKENKLEIQEFQKQILQLKEENAISKMKDLSKRVKQNSNPGSPVKQLFGSIKRTLFPSTNATSSEEPENLSHKKFKEFEKRVTEFESKVAELTEANKALEKLGAALIKTINEIPSNFSTTEISSDTSALMLRNLSDDDNSDDFEMVDDESKIWQNIDKLDFTKALTEEQRLKLNSLEHQIPVFKEKLSEVTRIAAEISLEATKLHSDLQTFFQEISST